MTGRLRHIRDTLPNMLGRALDLFRTRSERAKDKHLPPEQRRDALCEACNALMIAHRAGLRVEDDGNTEEGGR